ncbi:MAG: dihydrolipoamide acetyltransferase family protein [Methylococcus sp.]
MLEFKLPSLGADMDEGTLLDWKVKPGDTVRKGQIVATVDTSKAAVDVEIWFDGSIEELKVSPGERIPVGAVMATLRELGAGSPPPPVPPRTSTLPPRISPAARKRALELEVDPLGLTGTGTGPGGAITLADIEQAAARAPAQMPPPPPPPPATHAPTPVKTDRQAEMRKAIAAAMSLSKREIPHYYLAETIPMARAQAWLTAANAGRPITERLLMAVVQLKAVAMVLRQFPELNGHYRDGIFQPAPAAHLGVAISLRQGGLIAPALHDVGDKTLETLMGELTDLVKRTRAGSLKSSELTDATITVTNLGEQGVDLVHGVIYPPQVALVGFGRITERAWVENGALSLIPAVTATLAADHRVSDGHRGALFLTELRRLLQQPEHF